MGAVQRKLSLVVRSVANNTFWIDFDDGALNIVILLLVLRMAPISSVAVNCDGTKCDGAGCWSCWSCQEVLCTV